MREYDERQKVKELGVAQDALNEALEATIAIRQEADAISDQLAVIARRLDEISGIIDDAIAQRNKK